MGQGKIVQLGRERFAGDLFNFELILQFSPKGHLEFRMEANGRGRKSTELFLPFQALPKIRQVLAKILTEHDGTKQIGPAPKIPTNFQQNF